MTLFARAFLLIALLIVTAVVASFQIYRLYEREPRSRELAQQTVSTINLTRAALVNADPVLRRDLLIELNETEGLRVIPSLPGERIEPLPEDPLLERVAERVRAALGSRTRFGTARDGEAGFWVSFFIDGDEYWVMMPGERFAPVFGLRWLGWLALLLALALAGAYLIASNIARPLAAMRRAARRLGLGQHAEPLPEVGPREVRTVAAAFNRMAANLESMERERAMVLAGISHDLRTPLSRLRLALEMAQPASSESDAMIADIVEMDAIIGQFLDFARGADEAKADAELDVELADLAEHYQRLGKKVSFRPGAALRFRFARLAVRRAVANLVDNALRYAGEPVEIETRRGPADVIVEVRDRGPGIPPAEVERLKRPFTRLEDSRSGPAGSGLGLAIVERVAHAHGGRLELAAREGGGLVARLILGLGVKAPSR
ncbi:MAG TPA: ATP-binding protein [Burkholderiales bacterium]|nr:ATP-binding protein [Burkholderiales bacterium]